MRVRELEQLPLRDSGLVQGEKTLTVLTMNGVKFHYPSSRRTKKPEHSSLINVRLRESPLNMR